MSEKETEKLTTPGMDMDIGRVIRDIEETT